MLTETGLILMSCTSLGSWVCFHFWQMLYFYIFFKYIFNTFGCFMWTAFPQCGTIKDISILFNRNLGIFYPLSLCIYILFTFFLKYAFKVLFLIMSVLISHIMVAKRVDCKIRSDLHACVPNGRLTFWAGVGQTIAAFLPWLQGSSGGVSSPAGVQAKHVVGPCFRIGVEVWNLGWFLGEKQQHSPVREAKVSAEAT